MDQIKKQQQAIQKSITKQQQQQQEVHKPAKQELEKPQQIKSQDKNEGKDKTEKEKQQSQQKQIVPKGFRSFECGGSTFVVEEKYEYIKQIGHGAYGVVCSANNKKTGTQAAIKKVTYFALQSNMGVNIFQVPNAFEDLIDAKRIVREIKLLKFFDHENIISLIDLQKPEAKTGFNDIYIITDLMETDLHRVIYSRQELTDEHIQYFIYQVLRATIYMHSANVIHRDLKPSNLLLNKNCDLKVCDLGLCRGFDNENELKTEYVVTRWYRAPEVILNASEYTKAVDIWSIGCILAELIGRTPLFPGEDYLDQIQRIVAVLGTPTQDDVNYIGNDNALKYLKSLPKRSKQQLSTLYPKANPVALDLVERMLTFNPNRRLSIEECLAHPYFEGLHNPDEEPQADTVFDWSWDNFEPTKDLLQEMVWNESLFFHPEPKK